MEKCSRKPKTVTKHSRRRRILRFYLHPPEKPLPTPAYCISSQVIATLFIFLIARGVRADSTFAAGRSTFDNRQSGNPAIPQSAGRSRVAECEAPAASATLPNSRPAMAHMLATWVGYANQMEINVFSTYCVCF